MPKAFVIIVFAVLVCLQQTGSCAESGYEETAVPGQTLPRPFDGEVLAANPPCFVFPATESFPGYVVEYSRDPDFSPSSTRVLSGRWMLNVPGEVLADGRWYWRWRPVRPVEGEMPWSRVRSFIVPPSIPQVPFPGVATLQNRIRKRHPRIMITADELGKARRRALKEFGATWIEQVKQRAAVAAKKEPLPEPAFLPGEHLARMARYQKTFRLYRPFFSEMTSLAEDYLLTGYTSAGLQAKRRLLSIVEWNPKGASSLRHNDEVGTEVIRHCPRVYDWIYPLLTPVERKRCLAVFQVRMREVFDYLRRLPFEKKPYESHRMGYFLPDLLQACLAVSGDMDVREILQYTMLQLWSPFYPPYGGPDGGWSEGPAYWSWIARVCANTYTLVERLTGVPIRLRSHLRKQPYYKLYANPPWFKMSPFGDGQAGAARGGEAMLMLAAMYGNPYAKWYGKQLGASLRGLTALVYPLHGLTARPPDDLPQGRAFFDVGLACSHTALSNPDKDVAFLLRASPFGSVSHAYADQNTFALDAYGEPLIIASGYYQRYGSPHHVRWTRKTVASNSILVNGKGQPRGWTSRGRLAEFSTMAVGDYIIGDAHEAYAGKLERFGRHVLFLRPPHTGGNTVILLHDAIRATRPVTITFLLHTLERMVVDSAEGTVLVQRGGAACRVNFLAPHGLRFVQNDRFAVPPLIKTSADQWHLRAEQVAAQTDISSVLVIQPYEIKDPGATSTPGLEKSDNALAVTFHYPQRQMVALFRVVGEAVVSAAGIRTDGEAASVVIKDGGVFSAVVFGGTFLDMNGKELIRSTVRGNFSRSSMADGRQVVEAVLDAPGKVMVEAGFRTVSASATEWALNACDSGASGMLEITLPAGRRQFFLQAKENSYSSIPAACFAAKAQPGYSVTVR